ncbi:hypothetical protein ACFTXM_23085 [Streptomyces sp. NPDC056930]|uniref:hypothetical protein n=1 Tax=Streptomyces sp. NPDC056930 TaxID=3345967 RepID=UPI00364584F6
MKWGADARPRARLPTARQRRAADARPPAPFPAPAREELAVAEPGTPTPGHQAPKDCAIPEQVAAELGVSRSTLYRELRKHRESATVEQVAQEG